MRRKRLGRGREIRLRMTLGRNTSCACGSGKRLKHCCGQFGIGQDKYAQISDEQLHELVIKADNEGLSNGEEPKDRAFHNVLRIIKYLEIDGVILFGENAPPIIKRINATNNQIFRTQDSREGGIHLGAFMFRDLFCRFHVPIIFGNPSIEFFKLIDLSDFQKQWLFSERKEAQRFEDQAIDLLDFGYGWMEFGYGRTLDPRGVDLIWRAHSQLEAAAATVTSAFDFRGTVQSAILGTELALKSGLAAHGSTDEDLRDIGHNLEKAAIALHKLESAFDIDRVLRVVRSFPPYVASRYAGSTPSRLEVGHILMGAQYVASEVTRQFSDRNLRNNSEQSRIRSYPA